MARLSALRLLATGSQLTAGGGSRLGTSALQRLSGRVPCLARASSSQSARGGPAREEPEDEPVWPDEETEEELYKRQRPLRLAVKVFITTWISYKAFNYMMEFDELMVSSTLMLLRSQKPETRASGLYRLDNWHTSDGARQAFVKGDGIEVLITGLSATRDAPTANLVLRLLGDLLRFEGAPERLRASGGGATASAACGALQPAGEDARCLELAADLERALQAA